MGMNVVAQAEEEYQAPRDQYGFNVEDKIEQRTEIDLSENEGDDVERETIGVEGKPLDVRYPDSGPSGGWKPNAEAGFPEGHEECIDAGGVFVGGECVGADP
ncbi:hypothetical protein [Thioalkalivibrio sp. ALE19]|uniref:hypothetical protein n=1 Tax=Thioalkalivibrio sp. ALE19 TaxID=1266909 RepID=UPI0012DBD463|nr:hypothetical protein [Thioalkalivibrio sp. ALE19]